MDTTQAFKQVMQARRSVRGFLDKPIDQTVIEEVLTLARQSPSSCNTQPWFIHVVTGNKKRLLTEKMVEDANLGKYCMDFDYNPTYEGIYQQRQYDAAKQLYSAMGIERGDKLGRAEAMMRNYHFFGAPVAAFITMDGQFGLREAADVGMFTQSVVLAFTAYGISTCIQAALGFHVDVLRDVLKLPANQKVLYGMSIGYEDTSHVANKARVGRAQLSEFASFYNE